MKKIISLSALLLGVILLAGCAKAPVVIDNNPPVAALNQNAIQLSMADWKTYQKEELGFELKIPSYIKVLDDSNNRFVIFKSDKEYFEVKLRQDKATSLDKYSYLDIAPNSARTTLGGQEAVVFEAPNGYCDGPGCSLAFIAYATKIDDDFYNVVFYGDTKLSDTEKSILDSFKFTPSLADWKTYINAPHSYSFKYPKDWTLGDSPSTSIPSPEAKDIAFDGPGYDSFRFGVSVVPEANCKTLRGCAEANRLSFGPGEQSTGLSENSVRGRETLVETITRPNDGNWQYYVIYYTGQYGRMALYRLFTITKATDVTATKPTFDQILSSVTFYQ